MNFLHVCHNYAVGDALVRAHRMMGGDNVQGSSEHRHH